LLIFASNVSRNILVKTTALIGDKKTSLNCRYNILRHYTGGERVMSERND
jgi:hypothetical protein